MPITNTLLETWNGLLDLLYPPKCLVCADLGPAPLCAFCRATFRPVQPPVCRQCGLPIAEGLFLCASCEAGTVYSFHAARAPGYFEGRLRQAILRLKYGGKQALAAPLGEYLAAFVQRKPFGQVSFDLLVPVPLHPSRLRQRGFNQSALLACEVRSALGVPVAENGLRRIRKTRPQVELRVSERAANVRGAFAADPAVVSNKTVLVIDDVLTSLHTVNECAHVLEDAGAKRVYVVAVARGI
ncbi:MAG TPA: ComF family protein [Chthonomonadales bacterium]|nr:ComF family protein [Chthonomonadales bacterium]